MEMYVSRIEGVMHEPIDIYVNPTYLPEPIRPQYDALWTPAAHEARHRRGHRERCRHRDQQPLQDSQHRIHQGCKAAGAKFSFGTNNAEAELGRLEYRSRW